MSKEELFEAAQEAALASYSPYSKFRVGAAILLSDGMVVRGTNVENRSFGLTNCAERTAVFTAIASGRRDFKAIAIACPDATYPVGPCGACRQVLTEFCATTMPVYFGGSDTELVETTIGELYPHDSLHDLG